MKRVMDLLKGLGSIAVIIGLVVAIPYFGVPFTLDRVDFVVDVFGDPLASQSSQVEAALSGLLVAILWIGWAMIAMSLLVEIVNQARGRTAPSLPVFPGIQVFSRRLVAASTLVYASFSVLTPAMAAGAMPTPVPATLDLSTIAQEFPTATPGTPALTPVSNPLAAQAADETENAVDGQTHVVERGDTWWSIAEDYLGDGLRWEEVRDANLGRAMLDGSTISAQTEYLGIGWELALPSALPVAADLGGGLGTSSEAEPAAQLSEEETLWVVDQGEHFWLKSEEALMESWGRQPTEAEIRSYWLDVKAENMTLISSGDVDLIFPGEELQLPRVPADPMASSAIQGDTAEVVPDTDFVPEADVVEDLVDVEDSAESIDDARGDVEPEAEDVGVVDDLDPEQVVEEPSWEDQLGVVEAPNETDDSDLDAAGIFDAPPTTAPTGNQAPVPDSVPDTQPVSDIETADGQSGLVGLNSTTAAVGFGAAGVLLATYKLRRLEKARRWLMQRRKEGEVPGPVNDDLVEIDQEVRQDVNEQLVSFYDSTWNSLAARPIGDTNDVAQPVLALRDGDVLQVLMSKPDESAPHLWSCMATHEDEAIWSIDVTNENLDALGTGEDGLPLMVTVGENLFVNLEATGPIGLSGDVGRVGGLVRSLAIEATSARLGEDVDVRITEAAATVLGFGEAGESAGFIAHQTMATIRPVIETLNRHGVENIYAARSVLQSYVSSTIVVCDQSDTDALAEVLETARNRRTGLAVLVLNDASEVYNASIDESGSMVFGPRGLRCRAAFASVDLADMFDRLEEQRSTLVRGEPFEAELPLAVTPEVQPWEAPLAAGPSAFGRPGDEAVAEGENTDGVHVPEYLHKSIIDLPGYDPTRMPQAVVQPASARDVEEPAPTDPGEDAARLPVFGTPAAPPVQIEPAVEEPVGVETAEPQAAAAAVEELVGVETVEPEPVVAEDVVSEPVGDEEESFAEVVLAPMVVRVLGDVQILGDGAPMLSTKELSMLTYLALEGDQNQPTIKTALYGPNADVKKETWKSLVRRFRAKVGVDRFPEIHDGRYRLVEVTTDYARFLDEMAAADEFARASDHVAALERYLLACSMIAGEPFGPEPGVDAWAWIDSADNHPRCHMSARIGDRILRGARLAMEMERYAEAMEIIDRGRVANPYSEELVCLQVQVMMHLQQFSGAETIVREYEKRMEDEFHVELPVGPREVLNRMRIAS